MKKLNWGSKLGIFASIYVIGILIFVGFSTTQDINLVAKDYYPQEMKYQSQIDKIKNTHGLKEKVAITQQAGTIQIQFPIEMQSGVSGSIVFYRPADSGDDLRSDIELDGNGTQTFQADKLLQGRYAVKIDWQHQSKEYYQEEAIYLSK